MQNKQHGIGAILIIIFIALVAAVGTAIYFAAQNDSSQTVSEEPVKQSQDQKEQTPPPVPPSPNPSTAPIIFTGTILAGKISPVIDFNQNDYDKALTGKKLVVLYFYANWCPTCRAEIPKLYEALSELNRPELVAFRVNFNDSDTDENEKALAREFGVAYQHTKVFLKNNERVLKSPETWGKERYLEEINKVLQ